MCIYRIGFNFGIGDGLKHLGMGKNQIYITGFYPVGQPIPPTAGCFNHCPDGLIKFTDQIVQMFRTV